LEQLLTPGENCISRKCLTHKELAVFSSRLIRLKAYPTNLTTKAVKAQEGEIKLGNLALWDKLFACPSFVRWPSGLGGYYSSCFYPTT
jgi:hypothetical protein